MVCIFARRAGHVFVGRKSLVGFLRTGTLRKAESIR